MYMEKASQSTSYPRLKGRGSMLACRSRHRHMQNMFRCIANGLRPDSDTRNTCFGALRMGLAQGAEELVAPLKKDRTFSLQLCKPR